MSRDLFDDSAETIRLSPRVLEYTDSEDDTEDLPVVNSDDDIVSEDLEVSENELIENNEFTIPVQESIDCMLRTPFYSRNSSNLFF